ncbi:MAG: DUF1413 domain-containing protein [Oscillospiraceae bacterium]|nr:DUF1413 domain-containing protein [Oscillospiraceae bacterium]
MDTEKWMHKAKISIQEKGKINEIFELRSLFPIVEWESLSKGDRIRFGKDFANAVRDGKRFPNVSTAQRAKNNHAQYIKIKEMES